ncbi:MAG: hypothetical protein KBA64_03255 [Armatimonadetes bacterium]|nr:hypothetical protein [Armatimonadota bacterium]NLN90673.1 hypothetical protein [candidate division WS1 bacterium]
MSELSSRFRGAFKSHFTAWSVVWDVLCSVAAVYLIHRNLPHWLDRGDAPQNMALYLSLAALAMGCLVSYRRANGLRTEGSWVRPGEEEHHVALLFGEVLASLAVIGLLLVPPVVYAAVQAPAALAPSAAGALVLGVNTALIALASTAVFFLLSGYTLGSEGYSVFAWVVVVLGFSRSEVAERVTEGFASLPMVPASAIGSAVGLLSRIFTPPIEELIKSSMAGSWTGSGLFLAQCALISAFALCLSAVIVSRWGKYSRRERREVRAQERATASSGGVGAA